MPNGLTGALGPEAILWFSIGLGAAYALTMACIVILMNGSRIDHGFLGLILLLTQVLFLISFSFLVAAAAPGLDIKIAVLIVDALLLVGSKMLTPRFLNYLESEPARSKR